MNDKPVTPDEPAAQRDPDGNTMEPLPGEPGIPNVAQRARVPMSK